MNFEEWVRNNVSIILLLVLLLILLLGFVLFIVLRGVNRIARETIENTLNVKANYIATIDVYKEIKVSIYNSNFRDIIISAFGFIYDQQQIDFLGSYQKAWSQGDSKVVVSARSHIDYTLPVELLESIIFANNFESQRIKKLEVYVIDSIGAKKLVRCREIRNILIRRQRLKLHKEREEALKQREKPLWYQKMMFWTSTKKESSVMTPLPSPASPTTTVAKKPKKPKVDPQVEEVKKEE